MASQDSIYAHCSNSAIRRAARQLGQLYDQVIAPSGLRGTQFSLLTQIAYSDSPTLKALAAELVMDLSALGHTLKPLIRDGLVELVPDARDRRVKRARLTEAGKSAQATAQLLWKDAQTRFDQAFGADKSAQLRDAMALLASGEFAAAFRDGNQLAISDPGNDIVEGREANALDHDPLRGAYPSI